MTNFGSATTNFGSVTTNFGSDTKNFGFTGVVSCRPGEDPHPHAYVVRVLNELAGRKPRIACFGLEPPDGFEEYERVAPGAPSGPVTVAVGAGSSFAKALKIDADVHVVINPVFGAWWMPWTFLRSVPRTTKPLLVFQATSGDWKTAQALCRDNPRAEFVHLTSHDDELVFGYMHAWIREKLHEV